jgi:cellulose synthase operon protein C
VAGHIQQAAASMGMGGVQIAMSPKLGRACIPVSSSPPTLMVGEALLANADAKGRAFVIMRALKLIYCRASALVRVPGADLAILIAAWVRAMNPNWVAPGVDPKALAEWQKRLAPGLPRQIDPNMGVMALEAAAALGNQAHTIGAAALAWGNHASLLAIGDAGAALNAIAWSVNMEAAPSDEDARAAWIARTPDARDLLTFMVSDAFIEARTRSGQLT